MFRGGIMSWRLCCRFTIIYLFKSVIQNDGEIEVCVCVGGINLAKSLASLCTSAEALVAPESRYTLDPACHSAQTTDILQAV